MSLDVFALIAAYLLGAIPVGYVLTKVVTGKNILEHGSGNIGSTNVKRIAGKRIALFTQLLDMLKGLLPVLLYVVFVPESNEFMKYFVALAAIIGHDFSVFLWFKGGKGVNTTLGASILFSPVVVLISVVIYFIVKWRYKYVSVGSLALSIALPLFELIFNGVSNTFYYLIACMFLIVVLHHKNIYRLLHNSENS